VIQPPKGLFFTPEGDPAPEYWVDDLANLRVFIDELYAQFGLPLEDDLFLRLFPVIAAADEVLRSNVRMPKPSVFKRAAAFSVGFMEESPLSKPFGPGHFGQKIGHVVNHQNAVVAFGYARRCLHKASYFCGAREVELGNPISLSAHFYSDLIVALAAIPQKAKAQAATFHNLALLYEALAYDENDGCYDPKVV
jgi:hypothetical protein